MRVLPRTVRGTWLLAGTVWLALCAAAWWALPAWPRAVIAVPGAHRLLGVGPGGRTVVVDGAEDVNDWPPTVAIRAWDTGAGSIRTVLPAKNGFATRALSPDGQWLAVQEWLADQNRRGIVRTVRLINLITGHDEELARPAGAPAHYEMVFSPDSHWLAVGEQEQESPPGVRLWDVSGRRPGAFLAAAGAPVTFSADSNRPRADPLAQARNSPRYGAHA
jgi:hypothetical protein